MGIKETDPLSVAPEVAANPASRTPLREMGLTMETEAALRKTGCETAGHVASSNAWTLSVLFGFTAKMISEIEKALGRLGLILRS